MGITIDPSSSLAASAGAAASISIGTALQSQVQSAETTDVEALFGSIGLGSNISSAA